MMFTNKNTEVLKLEEKLMRSLIDEELLANYDASAGFDLDHLAEFKVSCYEQEKKNLKDDPAVNVYEKMIPGPEGAPDIKLRIYEPADRGADLLPCGMFFHGGGVCVSLLKNRTTPTYSAEFPGKTCNIASCARMRSRWQCGHIRLLHGDPFLHCLSF